MAQPQILLKVVVELPRQIAILGLAILNADANGGVKDAAFVLFDPSWIADQPAFAFKGGGATAAAGGGKKKIDF